MNKYKIEKRMSDGAFGTVYRAICLDPQPPIPSLVAIKQVYSSSNNLQRQLKILKQLPSHPHLVQIYDTITQNFNTNIIMQKGQYDLSHWINHICYPISDKVLKIIAKQILEGVKVVHFNGIIHRDLKPSNLIIRENGNLALCDFGSAVACSKGEQYQIQGFTRWYKCPEMLFGFRKYKYQVDIWSLGCILMEVATGQPLFNSKSQIEQISLVAQLLGDPSPQNWPSVVTLPDYKKINFKTIKPKTQLEICKEWNISPQLCNFIMKMVRYQDRPSAEQLLKDEFLNNIDEGSIPDPFSSAVMVRQHELVQKARKMKQ